MKDKRYKINKHLLSNQTANTIAFNCIINNMVYTKDFTRYEYDKETNLLTISDGLTTSTYKPLITKDSIDPFHELVNKNYGGND